MAGVVGFTAANYSATVPRQSTFCGPVNLILFQPEEIGRPLDRRDPRAGHLLTVLRREVGGSFDAGLVNGPRGKGTVDAITATHVTLTFQWQAAPPPPDPVILVVGLPRPQTARRILHEAAALGVEAMHFVRTARGEASYADSTLWSSGEWRRHVQDGVAQAFCTQLPEVTHGRALAEAIAGLPAAAGRLALDNYESPQALSAYPANPSRAVVLALGAERGWTGEERETLRQARFDFAHLGPRVLRLETAVVAALAVVKARRGAM